MWGPLKSNETKRADAAEAALRAEQNDWADTYSGLVQQVGELEKKLRAIAKPTTEEGLDAISADVAAQIDNLFVRAWGSPRERTLTVHTLIRETIRTALTGEATWNAHQLTRERFGK